MLYAFSTNRVKLVARKPETTDNMGRREYVSDICSLCVDSKAQLIHGLDWCSSLIAAFPASDSNVSFRLRACLTKQAGTCRALDNDRHCSFA